MSLTFFMRWRSLSISAIGTTKRWFRRQTWASRTTRRATPWPWSHTGKERNSSSNWILDEKPDRERRETVIRSPGKDVYSKGVQSVLPHFMWTSMYSEDERVASGGSSKETNRAVQLSDGDDLANKHENRTPNRIKTGLWLAKVKSCCSNSVWKWYSQSTEQWELCSPTKVQM